MVNWTLVQESLGFAIIGAPAALLALLGLTSLVDRPLSERAISRCVAATTLVGLLAAIGVLIVMVARHSAHLTVEMGNWIVIPEYHFSIKLLFDYLSVSFVILTFALCGTISAFATKYLHREPGFNRFFVLYAMFVLGMVATALAGTIETLFAGWELVGLSSALLVAFFQERVMPVRNGLRVWTVYRVSDVALLIAAVALHGMRGQGDFDALFGAGPWPTGAAWLQPAHALFVGTLLLIAAAGKSALVPFCGWLPRAMEGPTPSSAVFYGALSVHLGAFLLLRAGPVVESSMILCAMIVVLGLLTSFVGALTARVQTDIKSALAFASLSQVGLIVAEIGLGLRWIALIHLMGHACLRTLQFLRAPTLLQDYRAMENAIGSNLPPSSKHWIGFIPEPVQIWLYRFAMERGYLDASLSDQIARPFAALFHRCDALERRWTDLLSGRRSRESDLVRPIFDVGTSDELS